MEQIHTRSGLASFFVVLLLASAIDLTAWMTLGRAELGPAARVVVALLPLPGNITLLGMVLSRMRRLDEFQKRVHFEAVVFAFLATGIAVFIYGYLEKAQAVAPLNMELVWGFMTLFYAAGYFIAANHYK